MPQELKVTLAQQAELVLSVLPAQLVSPDQWVKLARLAQLVEEVAQDQPVLQILPERRAQQNRRAPKVSPVPKARLSQQDRRAPRESKVQRALREAKARRAQQERRAVKDRRVQPAEQVQEVQQVLRVPLALLQRIQRPQVQPGTPDPPQP